MPRICAFGCKLKDVTMHRFPNYEKFPERFQQWVTLCGGKLQTTSDYELFKKKKVCDIHFTNEDHNRFKRLKASAVPSLYLPGGPVCEKVNSDVSNISEVIESSSHTSSTTMQLFIAMPKGNRGSTESEKVDLSSQALSSQQSVPDETLNTQIAIQAHVLDEHNYTTASRDRNSSRKRPEKKKGFNSAQFNSMRAQIKKLRSEICQLKRRGKFKTRLNNAKTLAENAGFQQVVQRMSKPTQLFINMQMQTSKNPRGRRFTIEEKVLSLSLYKKSPKCYALLHKYFTLPSGRCMKQLLSKIKLFPGINPIIFEKIKKTIAEKGITDKLCSLAFDEMSITAQINYNNQKDTIEGFASNNENQFADHALVFMVKGVKQNFKQPIAYYFTNCLNKIELKRLIKIVICHAQDAGLIIVNTVCDQSTVNVSAINDLVEEKKAAHLRKNLEWRYDHFSVRGRMIIPLFDTPHLLKGVAVFNKVCRHCWQDLHTFFKHFVKTQPQT